MVNRFGLHETGYGPDWHVVDYNEWLWQWHLFDAHCWERQWRIVRNEQQRRIYPPICIGTICISI